MKRLILFSIIFLLCFSVSIFAETEDTPAVYNQRTGYWYLTTDTALAVLKTVTLPTDNISFGVQKSDQSYEEKILLEGENCYKAFNNALFYLNREVKRNTIRVSHFEERDIYTADNVNYNSIFIINTQTEQIHFYKTEVK